MKISNTGQTQKQNPVCILQQGGLSKLPDFFSPQFPCWQNGSTFMGSCRGLHELRLHIAYPGLSHTELSVNLVFIFQAPSQEGYHTISFNHHEISYYWLYQSDCCLQKQKEIGSLRQKENVMKGYQDSKNHREVRRPCLGVGGNQGHAAGPVWPTLPASMDTGPNSRQFLTNQQGHRKGQLID